MYEVIAQYETTHHNYGSDTASYSMDYTTEVYSYYKEALARFNQLKENSDFSLYNVMIFNSDDKIVKQFDR